MKIQLKSMLGTSRDRFGGGKMLQLTNSRGVGGLGLGDFMGLDFAPLPKIAHDCAVEATISVVSGKWKPILLY